MTELKRYTFDEIAVNLPPKETRFYIATEADKAIEKLEQELAIAYKNIQHQQEWRDNLSYELNRTKRALWLARAEVAKEKAFNWRFRNPNNNDCLYGINYLVEYDERKIRRTNTEWFNVFSEVHSKCRTYADKFK